MGKGDNPFWPQRRNALMDALRDSPPLPQRNPLARPVLQNHDGTVSTEETITIEAATPSGLRYFNIPTIVNGRRLSEAEATDLFYQNKNVPVGGAYLSIDEAVNAARVRTNLLGRLRGR
jgi:hypothetical protein